MTLALTLAALRRHPLSLTITAVLAIASASLARVSVPLALALWAALWVVAIEVWYVLEPFVLRRLIGLRDPSHTELELLDPIVTRQKLQPLISDDSDLAFGRGLRCLVVGRDVLEVLEERALHGLLSQAATPLYSAERAGVVLVWLGNLPIVAAWLIGRGIALLARLLGVLIGQSLVVPLVLWPVGFVQWSGRVLGLAIVGLLGAMLVSSGLLAAGLVLLLAWMLVPGLQVVLNWERRRVDRAADQAAVDAGLGAQLLEALEFLVLAESRPTPRGLLGFICAPGGRLIDRARRIRWMLGRP